MPEKLGHPRPSTASNEPKVYTSTACDQCFRCKLKCTHGPPRCGRCREKNVACTYSTAHVSKGKKTRKGRGTLPIQSTDSAENASASNSDLSTKWQDHGKPKLGSYGSQEPVGGAVSPRAKSKRRLFCNRQSQIEHMNPESRTHESVHNDSVAAIMNFHSPGHSSLGFLDYDIAHVTDLDWLPGKEAQADSMSVRSDLVFEKPNTHLNVTQSPVSSGSQQVSNAGMMSPVFTEIRGYTCSLFQFMDSTESFLQLFHYCHTTVELSFGEALHCIRTSLGAVSKYLSHFAAFAIEEFTSTGSEAPSATDLLACVHVLQQSQICCHRLVGELDKPNIEWRNENISVGKIQIADIGDWRHMMRLFVDKEISSCTDLLTRLCKLRDRPALQGVHDFRTLDLFIGILQAKLASRINENA